MSLSSVSEPIASSRGFPTRKLGHINLYVGDVEASMDFYVNVCGIEEVFRERQILAGFVSNGTRHHDVGMIQVSTAPKIGADGKIMSKEVRQGTPGLNHLAFEVDTEAQVVAAHDYLLERGLKPSMTVDHGLARSVYIRDPAGNLAEFYADSIHDWRGFFNDALARNEMVTRSWTPGATEPSTAIFFEENPALRGVEGAPLRPISISHAVIEVPDIEAAAGFYIDIGGMIPLYRSQTMIVLKGKHPGAHLALVAGAPDASPRIHHTTFLLPSTKELAASEARLAAAGVAIVRRENSAAKSSLVIEDPDGNPVEFAFYAPGNGPGSALAGVADATPWMI